MAAGESAPDPPVVERLSACIVWIRRHCLALRKDPLAVDAADCIPLLGAVRDILVECPPEDVPALLAASSDSLCPITSKTFLPLLESLDEGVMTLAATIITLLAGQGDGIRRVTLDLPVDVLPSTSTLSGGPSRRPGTVPWDLQLRLPGTAGYGVGGLLWPSAHRIAGHLLDGLYTRHGVAVRNARVLEVGCGACPIPGLLCARLGAQRVVLTDVNLNGLLDATRHNVHINMGECDDTIQVAELDWLSPEASIEKDPSTLPLAHFDIVFGSDVIYDAWMAHALPPIISRFLKPPPTDFPTTTGPRVVMVLGDRSRSEGIESFEAHMAQLGFETIYLNKEDELSEYVFQWGPLAGPPPLNDDDRKGGADCRSGV